MMLFSPCLVLSIRLIIAGESLLEQINGNLLRKLTVGTWLNESLLRLRPLGMRTIDSLHVYVLVRFVTVYGQVPEHCMLLLLELTH